MSYAYSVYPPEVWANESLLVLTNELLMANLVHRDFEPDVRAAGDIVHTRKPRKFAARTLSRQTGTDASDTTTWQNPQATDLSITLGTHSYVGYLLTDRAQAESLKDLQTEYIKPAIDPIAQAVDTAILAQINSGTDWNSASVTAVANGTVGANAAMDHDDVIAGAKAMNDNAAPMEQRRLVLSSDHHADLLSDDTFQFANRSGRDTALRRAEIGPAFGFDTYMSQQVPDATDTASTPQSFGFHRNAVTLCVRPMADVDPSLGVKTAQVNRAGLSIRVVISYESAKSGVGVKFEILYGTKLLDAALATIINP